MKRIATMALAAATLIAPLATPISASAQDWGYRDQGRYDRDYVGWHVTKVYARAAGPNSPSYQVQYFSDPGLLHIPHFVTDRHNRTIEFVLFDESPTSIHNHLLDAFLRASIRLASTDFVDS